MSKLYEIRDEYLNAFAELTEALADSEFSQDEQMQIVKDSLMGIVDKFESKALAVGKYIASLDFEIDNLDVMQKRIADRKRAAVAKRDNLKQYLLSEMQVMDCTAVKDAEIAISVRANPAKVHVYNEAKIPDEYKTVKTEISIAKSAIATAIKSGIKVEGAVLEQSSRIDIK